MVRCPEDNIVSSDASLLLQLRGRTETDGTETKLTITPERPWLGVCGPLVRTAPSPCLWSEVVEEEDWIPVVLLIKLQSIHHHRGQHKSAFVSISMRNFCLLEEMLEI